MASLAGRPELGPLVQEVVDAAHQIEHRKEGNRQRDPSLQAGPGVEERVEHVRREDQPVSEQVGIEPDAARRLLDAKSARPDPVGLPELQRELELVLGVLPEQAQVGPRRGRYAARSHPRGLRDRKSVV